MIIHTGFDKEQQQYLKEGSRWRNVTRKQIVEVYFVGSESMSYRVKESNFVGRGDMDCKIARFLRLYRPI